MAEHIDVFLSSTSRDLTDYRAAVDKVIRDMNLYTIGMEHFQPSEDNPVQVCYDKVQDAKLFVGIYAYRYGYIPQAGMPYTLGATDGQMGITHMEYEWARDKKIPILLFIVDEKHQWEGPSDADQANLDAFKKQVMTDHVVGFFTTPDNLAAKVATALHDALKRTYQRQTPGWNRPQTPLPPSYFAGRAAEINTIQRLLDHPGAQVVIQGLGGIGKTALAKYMAQRLGRDYAGGALWAELGPTLTDPGAVRSQIYGQWKNVTLEGQQTDLADVTPELLKRWLGQAPGRLLAVIDDVWAAEALKPLLDVLPPEADVILTTRDAGVHPMGQRFALKKLTPPDALRMLKGRLDLSEERYDDALNTIVEMLDYHALALDIAAAKLSSSSVHDAARLIERLQRHRAGDNPFKELKLGDERDVNLEAALALSYEPLDATHQRYFRALGIIPPGLDFARRMALAVWNIDLVDDDAIIEEAEDALDRIAQVGLAGRTDAGRYALHNLLTDYARALLRRAEEEDDARQQYEAEVIRISRQMKSVENGGLPLEEWDTTIGPDYPHVERYGDDLVVAFAAWWERLDPKPNLPDAPELPGNVPALRMLAAPEAEPFTAAEAISALLQRALDFVYRSGGGDYVYRRHIDARGLDWLRLGLVGARLLDDQRGASFCLVSLGYWFNGRGHKQAALEYYEWALPLYRAVGDRGGEATTLNNIGGVYDALGEKARALEYYELALPLVRAVGDRSGEATTLTNIGAVYRTTGEPQRALEYYELALPLMRAVGDRGGEAATLNNIGLVYNALGEKARALEYYELALPLVRAVGDRGGEATTLNNIGEVYRTTGERQRALEYYELALPLVRAVGDRGGEATTLNNIGLVYDALGEKARALEYYELALPLRRAVGDRGGEATTLNNIGLVYADLGEKARALEYYELALLLVRAVGDRGGEATTLNNMSYIYFQNDDLEKTVDIQLQIIQVVQSIGAVADEALYRYNLAMVYQRMGRLDDAIQSVEAGRDILIRYNLPQDAGGGTVADYDTLLAQLKAQRDGGGASDEDQLAQAMQAIAQLYNQGGAAAVRQALQGQVPDEAIETIIARLAGQSRNTLPVETIQQFANNTFAVMTSASDQRDAWQTALQNIRADFAQRGDEYAIEVAFADALLAILAGETRLLPDDNPYAGAVAQIHSAIKHYHEGDA